MAELMRRADSPLSEMAPVPPAVPDGAGGEVVSAVDDGHTVVMTPPEHGPITVQARSPQGRPSAFDVTPTFHEEMPDPSSGGSRWARRSRVRRGDGSVLSDGGGDTGSEVAVVDNESHVTTDMEAAAASVDTREGSGHGHGLAPVVEDNAVTLGDRSREIVSSAGEVVGRWSSSAADAIGRLGNDARASGSAAIAAQHTPSGTGVEEFNAAVARWEVEQASFDTQILPGIKKAVTDALVSDDQRELQDIGDTLHSFLGQPDAIASNILSGTRVGAELAQSREDSRRVMLAHKSGLVDSTQTVSSVLVPAEFGGVDLDGNERIIVSPDREFSLDVVSGLYHSDGEVIASSDREAHEFHVGMVRDSVMGAAEQAHSESGVVSYRYDTEVYAAHEKTAFGELIGQCELTAEEYWCRTRADRSVEYLVVDIYDVGLSPDNQLELIPSDDARGFQKIFGSENGQFHNVQPGLSVEGYVRYANGGAAIMAAYESDRVYQDDGRVRAEVYTQVRPVALTAQGLTVAQGVSNAIFREQHGLDPTINPHEFTAKSSIFAKAVATLDADRAANAYIQKALQPTAELAPPETPDTLSSRFAKLTQGMTAVGQGAAEVAAGNHELPASTVDPQNGRDPESYKVAR